MNKKLEARVVRLERVLSRKNESEDKLTVGKLIDYLSKFDLDKVVKCEVGDVFRYFDTGDIYDAGGSVNFDFT